MSRSTKWRTTIRRLCGEDDRPLSLSFPSRSVDSLGSSSSSSPIDTHRTSHFHHRQRSREKTNWLGFSFCPFLFSRATWWSPGGSSDTSLSNNLSTRWLYSDVNYSKRTKCQRGNDRQQVWHSPRMMTSVPLLELVIAHCRRKDGRE